MFVTEATHRQRRPAVRIVKPSLLDPCLRGDPWIDRCYLPNCLVVHLNNQPVALLAGTPLDQSSLNQLMFRMRHRFPRQWAAA
ncbi:MAG: hypothetical protein L0Y71_01235 [Gemmataceae bacterium]|nr:hypothetical protein [Gemmataceae bacterium]